MVILIIAVIAVALAPQVMKWVETARRNSDENIAASIKSVVLAEIAGAKDTGITVGKTGVMTYSNSGAWVNGSGDAAIGTTLFNDLVTAIGDMESAQSKGATGYTVSIKATSEYVYEVEVAVIGTSIVK